MQKLIEKCSLEADNVEIQEEPDMTNASVKEDNQESRQLQQQQEKQQQQLSPNNILAQMLGSKLKIGENISDNVSNITTTDKMRNSANKNIGKRKSDNNGNSKKDVISVATTNAILLTEDNKKDFVCEKVPGLSKEQFKVAFINLLENDEAFLTSLHSSYSSVLEKALCCNKK